MFYAPIIELRNARFKSLGVRSMQLVLRKERLRRGWSQTYVSVQTGVHPATLSRLERGQVPPWPAYRRKLAELFDMDADELFQEVPDDEADAAR